MAELNTRAVGVVRAIHRFPVKSMRGESLSESEVDWTGLPGDRCYAFVQSEDRSSFPYLTAREAPELLLYTPRLVDASRPYFSHVVVRTPEGIDYPLGSDDLNEDIARHFSRPFYLLRLGRRSTQDIAPLSVLTTSSVASLGKALETTFDPMRFRPTILIETPDGEPYPEQAWVGQALIFGDAADAPRMHVSEPDERCKMITLDPATGAADPRVLEYVVRSREGNLGIYGLPTRLGMLRVGQTVFLQPD